MSEEQNAIDPDALDALAGEYEEIEAGEETGGEPEGPQVPTEELIFPIVNVAAGVLAPNWRISEEETKALAKSYGDVLDKYFPDVGSHFGVELNALLITAAVVGPRLGTPPKLPPPEPEEEERTEAPKPSPAEESPDLQVAAVNVGD